MHRRLAVLLALLAGVLLAPASSALGGTPKLDWKACEDGFECATAKVPLDYAKSNGRRIDLAVIRLPAADPSRRIGSLLINFGGPGAPGVEILRAAAPAFAALNDRFDLVAWDPRGVGQSDGAIDCDANPEVEGPFAQPFVRPNAADEARHVSRVRSYIARCLERNAESAGLLPYTATTNTVRDLERLRGAVGDDKLNYLGYSYGTFIGGQYATLYPGRARVLALDGAFDIEGNIDRPLENVRQQTSAFERALGRFFQACAAQQDVCAGFGGTDPWSAFDELAERLDAAPIPAPAALRPRDVDGDDLRAAAFVATYSKGSWPFLALALAQATAGDGSIIRDAADGFYGLEEDGTYNPGGDQFVSIYALDNRWPERVTPYLKAGRHAYLLFDHFWWNNGYGDLGFGLWPVRARGAYYGPIENPDSAAPALVVGTTYDPATPFREGRKFADDLGNARFLTMRGDGHTASFLGNTACIDGAVEAYLEERTLPAAGTVCRQEVPFALPPEARSAAAARRALRDDRPVVTVPFGGRGR